MPSCTDTDRLHLERTVELAQRGPARSSRTRSSAPWSRATARCSARAGTHELRRRARRGERDRGVRDGRPRRRDPVRVAGAVLPRGQDAAVHRGDPRRRASGASSSPPMTRPRRPPGAAWGSSATRASRWWSPTASSRPRARLLNQAFRKHARVGRPWVLFKSAMTLDGKVATRTGDSQWISGEREPRARAPLARRGRRGRRRASARRSPTTRS